MQLEGEKQQAKPVIPFIGLRNMGNTCYLNSILQILYFCPYFENKLSQALTILECEKPEEQNGDAVHDEDESLTLIKELQALFSNLNENQMQLLKEGNNLGEDHIKILSAIRPESFINSLRKLYPVFEPFTQQDAQECFHCILSLCKSAISSLRGTYKNFYTESVNTLSCKVVGGRKMQVSNILGSSENKTEPSSTGQVLQNKSVGQSTQQGTRIVLKRKLKKDRQVTKSGRDEEDNRLCRTSDCDGLLVDDSTTGCFEKLKQKHSKFNASRPNLQEKSDISNAECATKDARINKENDYNYDTADIDQEPPTKKTRFNCEVKITSKTINRLPAKSLLKGFLTKKRYNPLKVKKSHTNSSETCCSYKSHRDLPRTPAKEPVASKMRVPPQEQTALNDFVQETFQGELITTIRCMECESKVHRSEMFQDISLPVKDTQTISSKDLEENTAISLKDGKTKEEKIGLHIQDQHSEVCSLSWALSQFTFSETLDGENKYFCDVCLRLSEGERSILFKQLPPILTFHLKRFSTTSTNFTTSVFKITSALEIPRTMKFTEWCSDDCAERNLIYELFGIVVHSGTTITSGHYLSYVKYDSVKSPENGDLSKYDGQWLEVDDEQVRTMSKQEINKALEQGDFDLASRSPYMLFYRRV